jgi:hypothetical protein
VGAYAPESGLSPRLPKKYQKSLFLLFLGGLLTE